VVEIQDLGGALICAVDIRGLIKMVPEHSVGNKSFDYCINGLTINHYSYLLRQGQHRHHDWCRTSILTKEHQLVSANVANYL